MTIQTENFDYPALPALESHYELMESPRGTYFWEPEEALPMMGHEPRRLWVAIVDHEGGDPIAIPYQPNIERSEFLAFMVTTEGWTALAEAYRA